MEHQIAGVTLLSALSAVGSVLVAILAKEARIRRWQRGRGLAWAGAPPAYSQ